MAVILGGSYDASLLNFVLQKGTEFGMSNKSIQSHLSSSAAISVMSLKVECFTSYSDMEKRLLF